MTAAPAHVPQHAAAPARETRRLVTCVRHGLRVTAHLLTANLALHTAFYAGEHAFHGIPHALTAGLSGPIGIPAAAGAVVALHLTARRLEV